jgi:hypothetical protein
MAEAQPFFQCRPKRVGDRWHPYVNERWLLTASYATEAECQASCDARNAAQKEGSADDPAHNDQPQLE